MYSIKRQEPTQLQFESRTIVFDLDGTLCEPADGDTAVLKYGQALPLTAVIDKLNKLSDDGWYIVIMTARRMLTHRGNIQAIVDDVSDITQMWLNNNGVLWDELIFGKPYAEQYVDDKAVNIIDFMEDK